jgi:two-component system LytT family response regulator
MIRFRALVADDEPLARGMIGDLLRRDPDIEAVVECGDARGVREALIEGRLDIAFLDVEMPEVSGLEIAARDMRDGPVVVFVTAFGNYARDAFDVNAIDYVLKPFSDQRFNDALERAKKRVRERRLSELASQIVNLSAGLIDESQPRAEPGARYLDRIAFKQGDRTTSLDVADVIWIAAEDYYVLIHARQGRHLVRTTLASLEDGLDPGMFVRVHRAAIVNIEEIRDAREENGIILVLSDGSRVRVSRSRRSAVESIVSPRARAPRGITP